MPPSSRRMGTLTMSERLGCRRLRRRPSSRPRRPAASSKKVSAVSRTEPSRSVRSVLSPAMCQSLSSPLRMIARGCAALILRVYLQVGKNAATLRGTRFGGGASALRRSRPLYPLFVLRGVRLATGHATPLRAHRDALLDAPVNPDAIIAVDERAVGLAAV